MNLQEQALLDEFNVSQERSSNGNNKKIEAFLQAEKLAGKAITKIKASDVCNAEKVHIQALYSALKALKIDLSNKRVTKKIDNYYWQEAIIKL